MAMQCPACAEEIPDRSRFCSFCGTPLRRCPSCDRLYPNEAEFCGICGTTLSAEVDRSKFDRSDLGGDDNLADEDQKWLNRDREGIFGFLYRPQFPEQRFYLFEGDITIGAGDKNDIVVDQPAVSWNHALMVCRNERILLQDSASTNGTFVNEVRVRRPRELHHGDLLRFGNVEYRLWIKPQFRDRGF
jgi:hypothetical protein